MQTKKWVYRFDELDDVISHVGEDQDFAHNLLGGKSAGLEEMARIAVPVPPGFTVTTEACSDYLDSGSTFPDGMWDQVLSGIKMVESETGNRFGDEQDPLLVSCRSGAKFSMPGMMDTVLYIGLNSRTLPAMIRRTNDARSVYDAYRCLIQMFGTVVMGIDNELFEAAIPDALNAADRGSVTVPSADDWQQIVADVKDIYHRHTGHVFPEDPYKQMKLAIEAAFKSWGCKRAAGYANEADTTNDPGTAVTIIAMVYGNMGDDNANGEAMTQNGSSYENSLNFLKHTRPPLLLRCKKPHRVDLSDSIGPIHAFLVSSEDSPKKRDNAGTSKCSSVDPELLAKLLMEISSVNEKKDVTLKVTRDTFEAEIKAPPLTSHISGFVSRLLGKIPGMDP